MLPREVLEGLFDEKKINILRLFFNKPEEDFYLREAARAAEVSPATTYRILQQLLASNIIREKKLKKTKFYRLAANENTKALEEIFEEKKGVLDVFVEFVSDIEGVERIMLHEKGKGDKPNVLVIGKGMDTDSINNKVGELKAGYNVDILVLTLDKDQYVQMSQMGLFPGKKTQLWPE